jgi:cytochrome c-type biogenesis protein CcmF
MVTAHLGIAVCIVGITMVKGYESERDVKLNVGDTVTVAGNVFRFDGVTPQRGPNYQATRGAVAVSRNGTLIRTLYPEKRVYNAGGMPMTNAAIEADFWRPYVSIKRPVTAAGSFACIRSRSSRGSVSFIMMAMGGFLAVGRRYRTAIRRDADPSRWRVEGRSMNRRLLVPLGIFVNAAFFRWAWRDPQVPR